MRIRLGAKKTLVAPTRRNTVLEAQKLEREKNGRCRLLEILPVPPVLHVYVYVYSIVRKKLPKLADAELGRFDVNSSLLLCK